MTCKNLGVALSLSLTVLSGCTESTPNKATASPEEPAADMPVPIDPNRFEIHGHRGARGLVPENSMPGFVLGLREGADVLEMDMCISADGEIIISHEPWMSPTICMDSEKNALASDQPRKHNLYKMTAEEIASFDCGSVPHPDFPSQRNLPAYKPTLDQVIKLTETVPLLDGTLARYNLEIKHSEELENEFCPDAESFARIVLEKINTLGIADRTCIQSFSAPALEAVHRLDPDMKTSWLVGTEGSVDSQLQKLTFKPDIYSPNWKLIDAEDVRLLQDQNIRVIPWTVNEQDDLFAMMEMGVNGIITDRPDVLYKMR